MGLSEFRERCYQGAGFQGLFEGGLRGFDLRVWGLGFRV